MTHTEMNLAIAKHIGWHGIEQTGLLIVGGSWIGYPPVNAIVGKKIHIPDFALDLNEMHKAEQSLNSQSVDIRSRWLDTLAVTCEWPQTKNAAELRFEVQYLTAMATSEQRAEAFLKTFNLWVEEKP